jgi:hypothetical protein
MEARIAVALGRTAVVPGGRIKFSADEVSAPSIDGLQPVLADNVCRHFHVSPDAHWTFCEFRSLLASFERSPNIRAKRYRSPKSVTLIKILHEPRRDYDQRHSSTELPRCSFDACRQFRIRRYDFEE